MPECQRLSYETLHLLPADIQKPAYDIQKQKIGIVHLGIGAFHRAHQAVYTDDILSMGQADWRILGVNFRSATVRDQLEPQDNLYTVSTRNGEKDTIRVIGSVAGVLAVRNDPEKVLNVLCHSRTKIVSLTVTEKGYYCDLSNGALLLDDPDIIYDLNNLQKPKTAIGFLIALLAHCRKVEQPPPAILSCDNLPANGRLLRGLILQFAERCDLDLKTWIEENACFPSTMVDRIVPATTDEDIAALENRLGLLDRGMVKTEPFSQWIIEDNFNGERPPWDLANAQFVKDVAPFEKAKLRLLNGPHSAIAYIGQLVGYQYVHQVMANPDLSTFVTRLMEEITPTLHEPDEMDLPTYQEALQMRFMNKSLMHRTDQIAMDGSRKLPQRLLETIRERLAVKAPIDGLIIAVTAWMRYVAGRDEAGKALTIQDPIAGKISNLTKDAGRDPVALADALLGLAEIFGADLPGHSIFQERLLHWLRLGIERGTMACVTSYLALPPLPSLVATGTRRSK